MAIEIVPYQAEHTEGVRLLNERIRAAAMGSLFPALPQGPTLLAPGSNPYHELFVAVEKGEVRGGYMLKHQTFLVGGTVTSIGCFQLPVSLGTVDRRYAAVGLLVLRDALKRQPLLFALGLGGHSEPVARLLASSGWTTQSVSFYFRVMHARRFLKGIRHLRRTVWRSWLLDTLAASGLGGLAVRMVQGSAPRTSVFHEQVASFGDWADPIWHGAKDQFTFAAQRDGATLVKLYDRPDNKTIRVALGPSSGRRGWAACLATRFDDHKYFGDLKVGTLVDGLCLPGHEADLVAAACGTLAAHDVDLIVTNQSFLPCQQALLASGFRSGPSNFLFVTSPALTALLAPVADSLPRTLLNRGDGDGPVNL